MKVRSHLALMAAAILLPVVLLSAVALKVLLDVERETARRRVLETTRLISLAVDQELAAAQSALRVLGTSAFLAKGDFSGFYKQAVRGRTSEESWIILYDGEGRLLLDTRYPLGTELPPGGDPARLGEVLRSRKTGVSNLFLDAAARGLVVTVDEPAETTEVRTEGTEAVLTVRDSGIGISPRLLPQIFEVFVQGDASLDRARGGLGIGLALVRQLVNLHGGTVVAASDGPGLGSVFTMRIALAQAPENRQEAAPGAMRSAGQRRVLLVDDHDDSRRMLSLLLQFSGYEALEARDGPEGLRLAVEEKPDVAVIDIGLPGTDGYEVARRLRADPNTSAVPLIALTGYGQSEDRQRALDAGFDLHLVKPVDTNRFLEVIAAAGH